jgi:phytoene dehydrogenase-like protein
MNYDAIVIGAGPNGLTAAAALAKGGKRVLVLERASEIGGHTRTIEFAPGFRSPLNEDMGWVPPRVARVAGVSKLQKAGGAISMSVAGADGKVLNLPARVAGAAQNIGALSRRDAANWPAFVGRLEKFAGVLGDLYQLVPPDIDTKSMREVLPLVGVGRKLRSLGRADMTEFLRVMPMPVQDLLDDTFESELLKAAIAAAAIRDLMQGPRSGGTTFNLLHHIVGAGTGSFRGRSWYLAAPDAFVQTAAGAFLKKKRVEIRLDAPVERITVKDGAVAGVALANGDQIEAGVVLSTLDVRRTVGMVDPVWLDPEFLLAIRNVRLRACTAFVFFAVDRAVDDAAKSFTAAVSLSPTTVMLERAADAAKYGELSAEPHIEAFSPTQRWPQLAPDGKHIVAARMQYAPYHLKGSWTDKQIDSLAQKATAAIARVVPGFESSILHCVALSPPDIEDRFGVSEGTLTHAELALDQIMFMRPVPGWSHYAMPIGGLFLGGSGAHPGPGVLGGAGYLAARTALKSL